MDKPPAQGSDRVVPPPMERQGAIAERSDGATTRASILRAVTQGVLAVRQDDGAAFDKDGAVYTSNGQRRRDAGRKLTTLPMDEATLVTEVGSTSCGEWFKIFGASEPQPKPDEIPMPPPPPTD